MTILDLQPATIRQQIEPPQEELTEAQKKLPTVTNENDRKALQQIEAAAKMQLSQQNVREQQLRSRESEVALALKNGTGSLDRTQLMAR